MLDWKAIFTLTVVGAMFVILGLNKWNDTLIIFVAFTLLWTVTRMRSVDALAGFASARAVAAASF
jgi:hypothetical protein